jgi:hypothetical protein
VIPLGYPESKKGYKDEPKIKYKKSVLKIYVETPARSAQQKKRSKLY